MYVIKDQGLGYVNFSDPKERIYTAPLSEAQRFGSVTEALTAVQDAMREFMREGVKACGSVPTANVLSADLTIERVITRTIPARTEETTEAL